MWKKKTEQTITTCGQSKYTQLFIRHTLINQDCIHYCCWDYIFIIFIVVGEQHGKPW